MAGHPVLSPPALPQGTATSSWSPWGGTPPPGLAGWLAGQRGLGQVFSLLYLKLHFILKLKDEGA